MHSNHISKSSHASASSGARAPSPTVPVTAGMDGSHPIKSHSVGDGRINVTAFSPDVGNMPSSKSERLSQFKVAIRAAGSRDIVMGPEYFFNKRGSTGLNPCTRNERDAIVDALANESARSSNREKTIAVGMVWQDPTSGKLRNTIDVFHDGEHLLAHDKKTTDQYDAIHFPSQHGWHQGSSDHAALNLNGQKIWLTTCSDNRECALNNRNKPEGEKPDLVLVPASGLGMPAEGLGKAGSSSVVCDADGHSREVKTRPPATGFTPQNIMASLFQNQRAAYFLNQAGISSQTNMMGLRRDSRLQDGIATAIADMINTRQTTRSAFSALDASGLFRPVMALVDQKCADNYGSASTSASASQSKYQYSRYSGA